MHFRDRKTALKYEFSGPGIQVARATAWIYGMELYRFVIPTQNPYLTPIEHYDVFVKGRLKEGEKILTRVQSACFLGAILGLDDCDCHGQGLSSLELIRKENRGLYIYCSDEHGKGVGLANHLKMLAVEKWKHVDEATAREQLGFRDARDYKPIIAIANHFGIRSCRLLTNNPNKLKIFEEYSIPVTQVEM